MIKDFKISSTFVVNVTLLFVTIIFMFIIVKLQSKDSNNKPIQNQPFEYMRNVNLYKYNTQGILNNAIIATYWQFFPTQQTSIIKNPNIMLYKDNGNTYNIIAGSANINKEKLIKLFNSVNIQQYNNKKTAGFNVSTSYLEFNPNTEIAYTTKHVTITKPGLIISGIGMNANLKQHQLELHKNVSTKYLESDYKKSSK